MAVYLLLLCFSFGIVSIEGFKYKLKTIRPYDTSIFESLIIPRRWKEPYQNDRYTVSNQHSQQDRYQNSEEDEYTMPLSTFSRSNEMPMSNGPGAGDFRNAPSAGFRHVVNITSHVEHRLVLFDRLNQGGDSILIVEDVPSLTKINFNDKARSVCVSGTWILYEHVDYNAGVNAQVEWKFSPPPRACSRVNTIQARVSSVRHVGHPNDYRADSITFYTRLHFQGRQYLVWTVAEIILTDARKVNSLIITGRSSWKVYEKDNFKGKSLCISPKPSDTYKPEFIENTVSLNIPQIQSVKKGC